MVNKYILGTGIITTGVLIMISSIPKTQTQATTECLSTPLFNPQVIPAVTITDFTEVPNFIGTNRHNLWCADFLSDGLNYYLVMTHNEDITTPKQTVFLKNLNTGLILSKSVYNSVYTLDGNLFTIQSSLSTVVHDIINNTTTIDISIPENSIAIHLLHPGKPFKYNDGDVGIVKPNEMYVKGIEIVGNSLGNINGNSVSGIGITERLNWNFWEYTVNGYKYIAFASRTQGLISGLLVRFDQYADGGVWENGVYLKPDNIRIDNLNFKNGYTGDQRVFFIKGSDIYLLDMKYIGGRSINQSSYTLYIYKNGIIVDSGYAWEENAQI